MSLFTTDNTSTLPLFSNTYCSGRGRFKNSIMDTFFETYFANMIIHKKSFKLYIPPTIWPFGILANWQLNPHPDSAEKEKEMQEKVKRRKVLGNMIQGQELHPTFAFSFYFCNSYLKSLWIFFIIYFSLSFWADAIKVVAFRHQFSLQQNYDNRNRECRVSMRTADFALERSRTVRL